MTLVTDAFVISLL